MEEKNQKNEKKKNQPVSVLCSTCPDSFSRRTTTFPPTPSISTCTWPILRVLGIVTRMLTIATTESEMINLDMTKNMDSMTLTIDPMTSTIVIKVSNSRLSIQRKCEISKLLVRPILNSFTLKLNLVQEDHLFMIH